jgi:DNA-3-methyladenine glycosylase
MGLSSQMTGVSLIHTSSPLWIEDRDIRIADHQICEGTRIGVESAGESAHWPWRFFLKGNKYVSARKTCS